MTNRLFAQDPVVNDFGEFLKHYGIFIAIGVAVIVAALVIILLLLQRKGKKVEKPAKEYSSNEIYEALGGKENVLTHQKAGSRISLTLNDYSIIDENKLNELGVDSVIKMSNKITLVIKDDSDSFYKLFD